MSDGIQAWEVTLESLFSLRVDMNIVIVFAGGSGTRMGAGTPKQFLEICGRSVLAWTLEVFEHHPRIDAIVLVCNPAHRDETIGICEKYGVAKVVATVDGGDSAQESIYNGLVAAAGRFPSTATVLLHDGVRPYISADVIDAVIDSVELHGNGVTYTPCYETLILSNDGQTIDTIPPRSASYTAQAPQGFRLGEIIVAHEKIRAMPERYEGLVDQATLCWKLGIPIHLVQGNRGNIKITTPEDLCTLRALLEWRRMSNGK